MPHISRKPSPVKSAPLMLLLKKHLEESGISIRKASSQMNIGASHLSHLMNGEKAPDAGVCNAIADFLGIPRVHAYGLAGWLDLDEQDDQALTALLTPFANSPEQLAKLKWIYFSIGDRAAREDFLQWVQQR
ncbi:helix-turn-helix domain-containing protein [Levilinea saccharolytica]|nr:helix-turn-helix transcriptional regulator [Levilinea saccharolytica]